MKIFCLLCAILFACCCVTVASAVTYTNTALWGSEGSGPGQFEYPSGIAVDNTTSDFYVADACPDDDNGISSNHRLQKFAADGSPQGYWNGFGEGVDKFTTLIDVAACRYYEGTYVGSDVYVSDASNRVKMFYFDDNGVSFQTCWGDGQFTTIGGIAVDNDENVYVADTGSNRVLKFAWDGTPIDWAISSIEFNKPADVAVGRDGNVYVADSGADSGKGRIVKLAPDGSCLWSSTGLGDAPFHTLWGIATDESGNVFVTDNVNETVHMLDATTGGPLTHWSVQAPQGIAVDKDGNVYVVDSENHRVQRWSPGENHPPEVTSITAPTSPVAVHTLVTATADFTDADTGDSHTAVWNWGDGTSTTSADGNTVTEPAGSTPGTVTGSHAYENAGIYKVNVTVIDNSGERDSSDTITVIVYDPSGGFATGGGWFISPEGAYPAQPGLTGKANFAFVSKYSKGATEPTSTVKFEFKAGDLEFESSSNEFIVVSGSNATYRGTGTLNGDGNYKFLLSVTDGSPDKVRIQIVDTTPDPDVIVYDNEMGADEYDPPGVAVGGGNVAVHN